MLFIANTYDRRRYPGGLGALGNQIKIKHPGYPHSREVLGIIFRAKDEELLNPPDSEKPR